MFILISLKQPDVVECIIYSLLGPSLGLVLELYRAAKYRIFSKFELFSKLKLFNFTLVNVYFNQLSLQKSNE